MANLIVRRSTAELPRLAAEEEPSRWMRWDPFRQMAPFWPEEEWPVRFAPDFEVRETKEGFLFKADLPGVKEHDLEITMTGNRLTISGKRDVDKDAATDCFYACERAYGSFSRAFTLPEGTAAGDDIRAELSDGVLTLLLPKRLELQPRKIEVKATSKSKS